MEVQRMNSDTPRIFPGVLPFREFSFDDVYKVALTATSKGNQNKYKTFDCKYYIKTRFEFEQCLWQDDLVEVIASQYAFQCLLPADTSVVKQGLCRLGAQRCSYSEAFDLSGDSFVSFSRALGNDFDMLAEKVRTLQTVYDWFSIIAEHFRKIVVYDASDYLLAMMLLDLVVANEDRHFSNFGFLRDSESGLMKPSVLFDFGLGLFEHSTVYYKSMPLERALRKVHVKPWNSKVVELLSFLEQYHSDFISSFLPAEIKLVDFTFPSALARSYFTWVNERLGVRVVDM